MTLRKLSQKQRILRALQAGRRLTAEDAQDLCRCFRLAAVVFDLRDEGYDVHKRMIPHPGGTHAEYYIPAVRGQSELL